MFQRLPKVAANAKFDPKNGWLPASFTDQCREIVNKYVLDAAQEAMRKDSVTNQNLSEAQVASTSQDEALNENEPVTYCSLMLSNIRKGIYKSANILPLKTKFKQVPEKETLELIDTVDLVEGNEYIFKYISYFTFTFHRGTMIDRIIKEYYIYSGIDL